MKQNLTPTHFASNLPENNWAKISSHEALERSSLWPTVIGNSNLSLTIFHFYFHPTEALKSSHEPEDVNMQQAAAFPTNVSLGDWPGLTRSPNCLKDALIISIPTYSMASQVMCALKRRVTWKLSSSSLWVSVCPLCHILKCCASCNSRAKLRWQERHRNSCKKANHD